MGNILIDGYNLIGVFHKDLKRARERLIESLIAYRKQKSHNITIVFDGYKQGLGKESSEIIGGIRVIYSGLGERADDVIKRILREEKKFWIVITSDREIEREVWRQNCVSIDSSIFYDILQGEEVFFEKQRGVTLSKKEKAIVRAIEKL